MTENNKLVTLVDGFTFPEAPRWRKGRLFFSDFYVNQVHSVDLNGNLETINIPAQPSGLGWTLDDQLLVVSMLDHTLLRIDPSGATVVADLSAFATGPANDMVVDNQGRAYIGNFGYDHHGGADPRTTCLVRVDSNGEVVQVADDLMFPNGMVITPDEQTLIVAETFANRLTAFDHNDDGSLSNRRVFADLKGGFPDGICLDAEGAIWVADPRNNQVSRVHEGGRVSQIISTGDRGSYACMLGGEDRCTLFICTNTASGSKAAERVDGQINIIRVETPGAGLP